jgi:mannose-6-phosphate isomerase-like protein (cupin superfamily)
MSAPRQPDGEKTLIPDTAERILRRSSILPLAPGVSPAHAEDPPLLWFVLEGECRLRHTDGTESVAKPGMFINGRACTSFTAREPGKILFFASAAAAAIAGPPVLPSSFWEKLGGSCAEKRY